MNLSNFGEKILRCRQNAGLTQEELALRIGVTPQAISRWERNQSMPDILILSDLCRVLNVSADLLLDTIHGNITGEYDVKTQEEIFENLSRCCEPLEIIAGIAFVPFWENSKGTALLAEQRMFLSKEGFLLPLVRVCDDERLLANEFMITAFRHVLYQENMETVDETSWAHIAETLGNVTRSHYSRILNRDIVKLLCDNLKQRYPALIENTVPENISYGLLTDVLKCLVKEGNSPACLPQIIEIIDGRLRENPDAGTEELAGLAARELSGTDTLEQLFIRRT